LEAAIPIAIPPMFDVLKALPAGILTGDYQLADGVADAADQFRLRTSAEVTGILVEQSGQKARAKKFCEAKSSCAAPARRP
jgi:hypothetical protein